MKLKETLNLGKQLSNAGWASKNQRLGKEWEDAKIVSAPSRVE